MRKLSILPIAAALAVLAGSAALANERITAAATLVDPTTHAYVGTFVESCPRATTPLKGVYVGVYLGTAINLGGPAWLSFTTDRGTLFTTSSHANGEETLLYGLGGQSATGCVPAGSNVDLVMGYGGLKDLVRLVGRGTVSNI